MEFPEPVIELAIEPKTKAGQGKMGEALAKLAEEDPTFRAHTDQETLSNSASLLACICKIRPTRSFLSFVAFNT